MKKLRIINEDTWQEDKYWICPYCHHKNDLSTWMDVEPCSKCQQEQIFETDYTDAYEGVISSHYIKPRD